MSEKMPDSWKEATEAPIKRSVGDISNKEFGPKLDTSEATEAPMKGKSPLAWAGHPGKGTNDIAKDSTNTPLSGSVTQGNRPEVWPRSHQK